MIEAKGAPDLRSDDRRLAGCKSRESGRKDGVPLVSRALANLNGTGIHCKYDRTPLYTFPDESFNFEIGQIQSEARAPHNFLDLLKIFLNFLYP